mgnify:CR=1 FL=1
MKYVFILVFSWHDTTAEDDRIRIAKGLGRTEDEFELKAKATYLFDDSMSTEKWMSKGKKEMKELNYSEAAASFYQAMVGCMDDEDSTVRMAEAQALVNVAVQAAREENGLGPSEVVSSSEGEGDY